jgi:uncharacterized lipoprotein YajG
MQKFFISGVVISLSLLLTACMSSSPPMINLQPQIDVPSSQIGQGKPVVLQVTDGRPANDFSSAKIESGQEVTQIIKAQMSQGLQSKGFTLIPIQSDKPLNHINITILAIDYRTMNGIASSNNEVFAQAQIKVLTSAGLYTKTYNTSNYSDSYLDAMTSDPSDIVNQTVAQLMNNILNDQKMLERLAK